MKTRTDAEMDAEFLPLAMTTNEAKARAMAATAHGDAYHSGGNHWLVFIPQPGGGFRVISDDMDAVYASREAFERGDEPGSVIERG